MIVLMYIDICVVCFSVFLEMVKVSEVDVQLENEFILDQLLQLAEYLDITDSVGR